MEAAPIVSTRGSVVWTYHGVKTPKGEVEVKLKNQTQK